MKYLVGSLILAVRVFSADTDSIIDGWLAHQTNIQTWTADFKQTRTLKALAQPLISTGQLWFAAPQNFRWELAAGQTIAIRNDETMLVIYPRLRRAERYQFDTASRSEWKDTLALLQSGFPRSHKELDSQFNILSVVPEGQLISLNFEPKSSGARKMMPRIRILLETNLTLASTELTFVDGSRMRNDFLNVRTNSDVEGRFELSVPAEFKTIEPLKEKKR